MESAVLTGVHLNASDGFGIFSWKHNRRPNLDAQLAWPFSSECLGYGTPRDGHFPLRSRRCLLFRCLQCFGSCVLRTPVAECKPA